MTRRTRTWLISLAVLAALIGAALAALPVAVRRLAEARGRALTGREVTIGDVDLNLFTRRLVVSQARLHGGASETAPLALERLTARFHLWPLLRGRVELERLALTGVEVYLERSAPDRFNVSDVAARLAARPAAEPLAVVVDTLIVDGAHVRLEDHAVDPARSWALADVALEAHDIATVADAAEGRVSATFELAGAPGELQVQRLGVHPLQARATLELDGLDLAGLGAYVPGGGRLRLAGGWLTTTAIVQYGAAGVVRANGAASIHDLALVRPGQDPPLLTAPALSLTARDLVFEAGDLAAGQLDVAAERLTVLDATAPRARPLDVTALRGSWQIPAGAPAGAPGRLALSAELPEGGQLLADGTVDLQPLAADVGVELTALDVGLSQIWIPPDAAIAPVAGRLGGTLDLRYGGADGLVAGARLRLNDLALARAGQVAPVLSDQHILATIRDLTLRDGRLALGRVEVSGSPTLTDASVTPAQQLHLPHLSLVAEGGATPGGPPARLRLDATLPQGGQLEADGTGALAPASLALTVRATDADLAPLAAYVPAQSPVTLGRGHLDAQVSVAWDGAWRADGRLVAHDLTLLRRGQLEPFIQHPALEVAVDGLDLRDGQLVVERVALAGAPTVVDGAASPPQRFDVRELRLAMTDVTWPGLRPAGVEGHVRVADGGRGELAGTVHPGTLAADVRARFEDVDVTRARGYLPPGTPLVVEHGRGDLAVTLRHRRADGVRLDAEGAVRDVALRLTTGSGVRVRDRRLAFTLTDLLLHDGVGSVEAVAVDGAPVLERAGEASPPLARLHTELTALRWPGGAPAGWRVVAEPAGGGRIAAQGTLDAATRAVTWTLQARDAAIAPFAALIPIDAPVAGRLDARLRGEAGAGTAPAVDGELTLREMQLGPPDAAPVRVARLAATGVALRGPALSIGRLVVEQPRIVVERDHDGRFPLRSMLMPASPSASPRATPARVEPAAAGDPGPGLAVTLDELAVSEGNVRFIDRTTTPAYSEELGRLAITAGPLTNVGAARAAVSVQGIVGVDAALELQGEVAPFEQPFFLDVRGELRSFAVPRTNPYLQRFLDWIARRGELTTRVHYRIVGDELTATNEITVQRLDVERADGDARPDRLIGLPLGLAVALLKDARGEIHVSLPVSGRLSSPRFSFGDAIRTTLKNVLGRLVTAPFRAIGSVFRHEDTVEEVAIEPVTFAPGSAVLTPDAAAHLQRVADFLRASPYVRLTLQPATSDEDVQALRAQEVTARIQRVQRERGLASFEEAARRVWRTVRPDSAPPATAPAIVRALAEREPARPEAALQLAERRLSVTRTELMDAAGIPRERLLDAPGAPPAGTGSAGRVEFGLRPAS